MHAVNAVLFLLLAAPHSGTALVGVLRTSRSTPPSPPSPSPSPMHDFASYDINSEIADFVNAAYKDLGDSNGNIS